MNKREFKFEDNKIYLIIIGVLTIILGLYQPLMGFLALLCFVAGIVYNIKAKKKNDENFIDYIEGLSEDFDSVTKHATFNMPFPLVMLDENGMISWYNTPFLNLMDNEDLLGEKISNIIPNFDFSKLMEVEENKPIFTQFRDKHYKLYPNMIDTKRTSSKNNSVMILYWVDNTNFVHLNKRYNDEKLVVSLIYVDNYDDVKSSTSEVNRPLVLAEIDKNINSYFANYNGIVRKYENDKYLVVYENEGYKDMKNKKFDLLDQMRELDVGNTIPITLSMGVCVGEEDPAKSYEKARAAVDVGLGRGGDQAVVQEGSRMNFYGGKTKAAEKRNKVKSRVIGYALRQLIDQSDEVFVMGHINPDMDSFGASIGILRAIQDRNKKGYMILNELNPSIKNIYETMKLEQPDLLKHIVDTETGLDLVSKNSLLVVVDNHKPSFTEAPEFLDVIDRVVLFDHHRRGAEFIEDPLLIYLEPYASSTCELVTEVLSYMSDKINLTKFEAEALLAGITVDTKNFSFQTGVRTFEAASTLKRAGADTTAVRKLFKDDFDTFVYKAEVIKSSKIVEEVVAIGRLERNMENSLLVAAQSADELLTVNGIEASFVMTYSDDKVHISGRSLGNISVQIILERLGGGGHLTSAGTQMKVDMDEAEKMLVEEINKYLQEGEKE